MSAFITLALPLTDQECLLAALAELGFPAGRVEVHGAPVPLTGYEGDQREQRAHIVIRKEYVGDASNDIGFERTATGFRAHVSEWDQSQGYGPAWLHDLQVRYSRQDALKAERLTRAKRDADIETRRVAAVQARRREEDQRRLVEAQRLAIHEKARKLGYRVQESRQGDTVRLVLVKRSY